MSPINVYSAIVLLMCGLLSAQAQPNRSLRGSALTPPSIPCPPGKCCIVLYNGDAGDQCDRVPIWDVTEWTHPGGSFVRASNLCGNVLHNWQSKAKSHEAFNPEDRSLATLPGGARGVGSFLDPVCNPAGADDVSAQFFAFPGAGLDFSISSVSASTEIGDAVASSAACNQHKTGDLHPSGYKLECERIPAGKPSNKVKGRWCICKSGKWEVGQLISESETPATPSPPKPTPGRSTGSNKKQQLAELVPEVIANAKMLCTIVDAIDCWQKKVENKVPEKDTPSWWQRFGSFMGAKSMEKDAEMKADIGVPVTSHRGEANIEAKFIANPSEMLEQVRSVCKVIDRGVDSLPEIIDEFVKPVLGNLVKEKLGNGLAGKIGGSILDKLLTKEHLDFSDIFSVDTNNTPEAAVQVAGEARRIGVVRAV